MSDLAAVTGSTGFIGSAVVRRLLLDGRSVRALIEPGANTTALEDVEAETGRTVDRVTVDVCDGASMRRALDGAATLFHLAAVYKVWAPDPTPIYRVNVEGTTTTLLAARGAGVKKIVYTSSIAAVGLSRDPTGKAFADESTTFDLFPIANEYILTKWLSERIAKRFADDGLPLTIVNPAFPFGPRDVAPTPTGRIVLALLKGEVPGVGTGGFNCVDVEDCADAHVAAETKGRIGERYILGDHNVTLKDFFGVVCDVGGVKTPTLPLPSMLGAAVALGMELWADHVSHTEPAATFKSIRYAQKYAFFDPSKARRELGLRSTPLRTSIERAVAWFRAKKMV